MRSCTRIIGPLFAAVLAFSLAACSSSPGTTTASTSTTPGIAIPTTAAPATTSAPASSAAPAAGGLSGTWSGQYSGAYQGTFVLTWQQTGSNLSGTINLSNPPSTLRINGTLQGNAIRFGTVGSLAITYTGTVSGNSMSGTYEVANSGGGPWSASRAS